ncbi:MAG: S1 RNA-binding domain-containing protein [Patescibacteria group bacterium]|nr:S1 RNA-binding domain-containing protein [Patescibacteria group bacterium]
MATQTKANANIKIQKPAKSSMDDLLSQKKGQVFDAKLGDLVSGVITAITKNAIIVDLMDGMFTGLIPGRETKDSLGTAASLRVGDPIQAVLVEPENEDGNFILSLRKATQISAWDRFKKAIQSGDTFKVKPTVANRGGLICDMDGIRGFIPVSQLMPQHYPRVENSNSEMILEKLKKLIAMDLKVSVMVADQEQGKLIFSERKAHEGERTKILDKLSAGQIIKGRVSGFSHFGIFISIPGGIEGLVHISEIAWERVQNPRDYAREGDEIEVMVLSADINRVAFSMKRLVEDPWVTAASKFSLGDVIECPIAQIVDYGAFARLNDEVNGLIHKSELADPEPNRVEDVVKIGDIVKAKIIDIQLEDHRIGLSIKELKPGSKGKKRTAVDSSEEEKEDGKKIKAKKAKDEEEISIDEEKSKSNKSVPDKKIVKKVVKKKADK